jgi:hypothetical protein
MRALKLVGPLRTVKVFWAVFLGSDQAGSSGLERLGYAAGCGRGVEADPTPIVSG